MFYKKLIYTFALLLLFIQFGYAQDSVLDVLEKSLKSNEQLNTLYCNLDYKYFPTYKTKKATANYKGLLIKNNLDSFLKIKETVFITSHSSKTTLKINKVQKVISVSDNLEEANTMDYLTNLKTIINQFETKDLIDNTDSWMCVLTAPQMSQLPYSRVELYINKSDYMVTNQILYISAQFPYLDDNGKEVMANPRLEISVTDYKTSISPKQKGLIEIGNYIIKNKAKITPVKVYENYKIL